MDKITTKQWRDNWGFSFLLCVALLAVAVDWKDDKFIRF